MSLLIYAKFLYDNLDARKPDGPARITHFRQHSLATFEKLQDSLWLGWALNLEQELRFTDSEGNEVLRQAKGLGARTITGYANCPANGVLNIVHRFESLAFVPIGGTPYALVEQVPPGQAPQRFEGQLDEQGRATISGCHANRRYTLLFHPKVGPAEIEALHGSYDGLLDQLKGWLDSEWAERIGPHWDRMPPVGSLQRLKDINAAMYKGVSSVLMNLLDDLKALVKLLFNLDGARDKLLQHISEADFQKLKAQAASLLHTANLMLHDELLMFFYATAILQWLALTPPEWQAQAFAMLNAGLLLDVLLGVVLSGGLGLAFRLTAKGLKHAGGVASDLLGSLQRLIDLSRDHALAAHARLAKPLLTGGSVEVNSAAKVPLAIKSAPQDLDMVVDDAVSVVRGKRQAALRVEPEADLPDAPSQPRTPSDKPAQRADETVTNRCPVSMVTGEELLTLQEAELFGVLPLAWVRMYRTSAAEIDHGLGPGWSHSLCHQLQADGQGVVWCDHENRRTRFPMPDSRRPFICNSLSNAAIFLGEAEGELVIAEAGERPRYLHFIDGRLVALSDAYDNRLTLGHDRAGRLEHVDNGAGNRLYLAYQGSRLVALELQVRQPLLDAKGREQAPWVRVATLASYHYNDAGQLTEACNGLDERERYRYDAANVILERRLAGGAAFYWEWEGEGKQARCVRHWSSVPGLEARYQWDGQGAVTVHNADGSQQVYQHDDKARLVRQVDADGAEHHKTYDDHGRLVAERNPLGAETVYSYDEAGQLLSVQPEDGEATHYHYRDGHVCEVRRGQARWLYQRNAQGDVIRQTDPCGQVTGYLYDTQGRLVGIRQPDGSLHELGWSAAGQLVSEALPGGGSRRYRYDALGRLVMRQRENASVTQYKWDLAGRVSEVSLPGGGVRRYEYNAYGRVTAQRDELGRVTRFEYDDGLHLPSRRIDPDGSVLSYRYDNPQLQLSEVVNARGEHYRLAYHPNGLLAEETGFDGQVTRYRYDLNGQLLEKAEHGETGEPWLTRYTRDKQGRLLVKTLPDGQQVEHRYDALGRLVQVDDGHWPLAYTYDLCDRLVTEHQGWATLHYGYDAMGRVSHCRLPDGSRLDYRYQPGDHLQAIDLDGQRLTAHRTQHGREVARQQGDLLSQFQYDGQGRLLAQRVDRKEGSVFLRRYHYDDSGNLTRLEDTRRGTRTYQYDPLDRLTAVRGELAEYFVHDPAGNLLAQSGLRGDPRDVRVDANRLLMHGDSHYDYDRFGNQVSERRGHGQQLVTRYHYDSQHRLASVDLPDGRQARYRYDAFGRRVSKAVGDTVTTFIWQGERLLAEHCQGRWRSYVYEPGGFRPMVMLLRDGDGPAETLHYHLDHLGTPQELTSSSGRVRWSARYRAYGHVLRLDVDHIDNPLRFQGQYYDEETGLHYNRHRYYNPQTGRYLTPDPIGLAGGVNGYLYGVNPTGWVDPLGLAACCPDVFTYKGVPVSSGVRNHLDKFDGYDRDVGIKGAHNRDAFMKAVDDHGLFVLREEPGEMPGLSEIFYARDKLNNKGDVVGVRPFKNQKTVYDPDVLSPEDIYSGGLEAARVGYEKAVASGSVSYSNVVRGIKFRVYLNSDNVVVNFHPSLR
ncbi:RHS repeat-associated core domain-containing protein [Pseudomonas sp. MWU13-3659]|uniref:RHS repeat-associated core domain-containing protein n=1 Tax=Pseudomonas sp. MWU13-3659 TaxID=2986964 RepID=UPI00256F1000|nr:RHS repeat-associated core domain-containing protein [Pseudomonas sp. MWU13-3659]